MLVYPNSDIIDAEVRATNANNVGLYNEAQLGESRGGEGYQNSSENSGTGFIRVYGNDGTNGPRYIPINNKKQLTFGYFSMKTSFVVHIISI